MSKISLFKFNVNDNSSGNLKRVEELMQEYAASRGLIYDEENKAYMTPAPTKSENKKNIAKSIGASVLSSVLSGGAVAVAYTRNRLGLEYEFLNGEFIVKAYLCNKKVKHHIHSVFNNSQAGISYYDDLKRVLFTKLKEYNVVLSKKEVVKIKDGAEMKTILTILGIYAALIILGIIVIFLLVK